MVIYIVMFIGIVVSVINKFPSAIKVERRSLYEEMYDSVIECDYRDRSLQLKRWIIIGLMAILLWLTAIVSAYLILVVIGIALYLTFFFLHYKISYLLDKKFYCTSEGIWFDKPTGEFYSYDDIIVIKSWRSTIPFSGYSDWLEVELEINKKRYVMACPNIEETDDLDLLKWLPKAKDHEISHEEKNKFRHCGWVGIIVGICLLCISAGIIMSESGVENSMTMEDNSYKTVLYEEQAVHGDVTTIFETRDGTLYALFDAFGSINVYDETGAFLYSYKVPLGSNGSVEFAVKDGKVYIKNRDDVVFVYFGKEYTGTVSLEEFLLEDISFVEEGENLDKKNIIGREKKTPFRDFAPALFIIGLILTIYSFPILQKGTLKV